MLAQLAGIATSKRVGFYKCSLNCFIAHTETYFCTNQSFEKYSFVLQFLIKIADHNQSALDHSASLQHCHRNSSISRLIENEKSILKIQKEEALCPHQKPWRQKEDKDPRFSAVEAALHSSALSKDFNATKTTMASEEDKDPRFSAVEAALHNTTALSKDFNGHAIIQHIDISCDSCGVEPIIGSRFKCLVCEDRDLCEKCMRGLIAARLKMSQEAGSSSLLEDPPPTSEDAPRPKHWISNLTSDDDEGCVQKWSTLLHAVPCLHPLHTFSRMDWGPERAVVLHLSSVLPSSEVTALAEKYVATFPPSKASCADVAWITLERGAVAAGAGSSAKQDNDDDLEDRIDAAVEQWEALLAKKKQRKQKPTAADIDALATSNRILRGKWIVFPKTADEADAAWAAVVDGAVAVIREEEEVVKEEDCGKRRLQLRGVTQLKISSTNPREPGYVLCAYTENYLNEIEVKSVAEGLCAVLPRMSDQRLLYKSDVYSYLGIYSKNEYGLKPTIYSATMM